ncbi:hypothetical protein RDI58_026638 [Solanum bulbocastanum]|uniref:Uncharacterized protein n=1 Tax=Solanum bulbocastanum TaxID=147425 RepID=A0AAN8SZI0_SOLBU
MRLGDSSSE